MRQFTRRKKDRVQIYFRCPEKMNRIVDMFNRFDSTDIVFTAKFLYGTDLDPEGAEPRIARFRTRLGCGWMGRDAKVHKIYGIWGLKGIGITINIFRYNHYVDISFCTIGNIKDREDIIHLGEPEGIDYKSCYSPFPLIEIEDVIEYEDFLDEWGEVNYMGREILNWEEEAIQGQVD